MCSMLCNIYLQNLRLQVIAKLQLTTESSYQSMEQAITRIVNAPACRFGNGTTS